MADFKAALTIGLSAALEAERRREEVAKILNELNSQIFEATNGKVNIAVGAPGGGEILSSLMLKKSAPTMVLVASTIGENKRTRTLSSWEQAKEGYPCKITIDRTVFSCEDKDALEDCLSRLLQDPTVGEKIHALMQADAV